MTAFQDWPDGPRMAVRHAIEWLDGEIVGYSGEGVQVRMPVPDQRHAALHTLLEAAGLHPKDQHYFPIGSESVPECRRHFGPHQRKRAGDRPGYTYSIHWTP